MDEREETTEDSFDIFNALKIIWNEKWKILSIMFLTNIIGVGLYFFKTKDKHFTFFSEISPQLNADLSIILTNYNENINNSKNYQFHTIGALIQKLI